MKSWTKRFGALLLALALLLSLGGCVASKDDKDDEDDERVSLSDLVGREDEDDEDDDAVVATAKPTKKPTTTKAPEPVEDDEEDDDWSVFGGGTTDGTEVAIEWTRELFRDVLDGSSDQFTFSIITEQDMGYGTEDIRMTFVRSGDNYAVDMQGANDRYTMIERRDGTYIVVYSQQLYSSYAASVSVMFDGTFGVFYGVDPADYDMTTSVKSLHGEQFICAELNEGSSVLEFYYDEDGELHYIVEDAQEMEVLEAGPEVDDSIFEFPADFTDASSVVSGTTPGGSTTPSSSGSVHDDLQAYLDSQSAELGEVIDTLAESQMYMSVWVSGDSLVYTYQYGFDLGDNDAAAEMLESQMEEQRENFDAMLSQLRAIIPGVESIIIEYLDMDGNTIYECEIR